MLHLNSVPEDYARKNNQWVYYQSLSVKLLISTLFNTKRFM